MKNRHDQPEINHDISTALVRCMSKHLRIHTQMTQLSKRLFPNGGSNAETPKLDPAIIKTLETLLSVAGDEKQSDNELIAHYQQDMVKVQKDVAATYLELLTNTFDTIHAMLFLAQLQQQSINDKPISVKLVRKYSKILDRCMEKDDRLMARVTTRMRRIP
jgi:hypothetical protein